MKQFLSALVICGCSCLLGQQNSNNFKYLDINNVKAGIWSKGLSYWDSTQQKPAYEVPAGGGKSATAGSGIWITGTDANGVLYTSAQTYPQNGVDFYPGFVYASPTANVPYSQVWKITAAEIHNFLNGGPVTSNIQNWPGSGNLSLNLDPNIAPYIDTDFNGSYDPTDGDYPCIRGDEATFSIFSDSIGVNSPGGKRLGIEIRCMAYAFHAQGAHPELANTTFMHYQIIYRGTTAINNAYLSLWNDVNIGYGGDDYTGCDVKGNYSFAYNGDSNDETSAGYGSYPPVHGYQLLNGPFADLGDGIDNDRDGCVDCTFSVTPSGTVSVPETTLPEMCLMNRFSYFNASPGTAPAMSAPQTASDYRHYATGYWKDGTPLTCGGSGYGGSTPTGFAFPDSSYAGNPCNAWSEVSATNAPGDRHSVMSCGPFTLKPGAVNYLDCAYVTVFNSSGSQASALAQLKSDMISIREFHHAKYDKPNTYPYLQCSGNLATGIEDLSLNFPFRMYPNPAKDLLTIDVPLEGKLKFEITDVIGKTVINGENERTGKFTVPVSNLTPGVYFIRLSINGQSAVKKFIRE